MYNSLTITPAYGRDYKSRTALLTDWRAGKDFMASDIHNQGYCSIRDLDQFTNITHLHFRYNKLTMVHVVKL
jgi:hypothetical protein